MSKVRPLKVVRPSNSLRWLATYPSRASSSPGVPHEVLAHSEAGRFKPTEPDQESVGAGSSRKSSRFGIDVDAGIDRQIIGFIYQQASMLDLGAVVKPVEEADRPSRPFDDAATFGQRPVELGC